MYDGNIHCTYMYVAIYKVGPTCMHRSIISICRVLACVYYGKIQSTYTLHIGGNIQKDYEDTKYSHMCVL